MFNWITKLGLGPADWRLIRAARAGDVASARQAAQDGANPRPQGAEPPLCAALSGAPNALAMCELLLSAGADPNQSSVAPLQSAPLHLLPFCDNAHLVAPALVKALLAAGASAHAKNQRGETPLTLMAGRDCRYQPWALEVCWALLIAGADPREKGGAGDSALEMYQKADQEAQSATVYLGSSAAGQLARGVARDARVIFETMCERAAIQRQVDLRSEPCAKAERARL